MKYETEIPIPTYILNKGVHKLLQYGMDVFEMFADEAGLSFCDRNRVISKCRLAYGRLDLREVPCPDSLKSDRWNFYTRHLNYSQDKARELIKRTDKSYQTPFVPRMNIDKVATGMLRGV